MMRHIMKAKLQLRERVVFEDGSFVEMKIWHVSSPVLPSTHDLKYSLVYVVNGVRVVGYDNERGKGDHRHFKGRESTYKFVSVEKLYADFSKDVERLRGAT
jgi:hypothetical protein